ncbi:LysR family transcriptional regulator [Blastococcus sp. CT_GayMR20]|uniref:LysR family transcriptional regulator n=1 Tax=Blastococcus sp. CT_GayMR20 TaxID=2559609 RepID=UPI00142FA85C|nr:LysR family transcriptional regulator [Blastococcus sp. CT_GayMR20]
MELRQFEHFLAVVEEGSFTRAAARVFMVQSSLSASLLSLERELGTELFIRGRRGAELTDAGRAFLGPARAALREADRARDAVAEVEGLLRGSVRVATVPLPRALDMSPTIGRFRAEHPGVDLRVVPTGTQEAVQLVADGEADFAIAPLPPQAGRSLRFRTLYPSPLVAVCPAGHGVSGAGDLDPRDLLEEPLIDLPRGWWARALFDRLLEERGLHRDVWLEVADWHSVLTMVQQGVGISYGPAACIDLETFDRIDLVALDGAPTWELGVVTREDGPRGAAGRAFLATYLDRWRGAVPE